MSLCPRVIALLGFGEAGSIIGRGLCEWRNVNGSERRLMAIDTELDKNARGILIGKRARELDILIEDSYTTSLSEADLVISAVPGEHALSAATSAASFLKSNAHFLDICTVTGGMADENRKVIEAVNGRYIDIAVMGVFFTKGLKTPMIAAGAEVEPTVEWMNANGFNAKGCGLKAGNASRVKLVRSVLIKGIEALSVEALVAADRQGILEEFLSCLADVDETPFCDFISVMVQTHIVHARRRGDEMGLVAQMLRETGVVPLMTEATQRCHRRTVLANIAPHDGKVPTLTNALNLLSERVVNRDTHSTIE